MRRVLLVILVFVAVLAAGGFAAKLWLEKENAAGLARLDDRKAYWKSTLNGALPLGSDRAAVEAWLQGALNVQDPGGAYNPELHAYFPNVEAVDAGGLRWPCGEWNVVLEIDMGADGKVVREDVEAVGACV